MSEGASGTTSHGEVHAQDYLNGWKDIASFLGKGVRTVQRWERDYDMPVHRIGKQGGEIVWASRRELDEWLRAHGPRVLATDDAPTEAPLASSPVPAPATGRSRIRSWWGPAAAYALAAVAVLWVSVSLFRPAGPELASWEIRAGRFTVLDREGHVAFFKDYPFINGGDYPVGKESRAGGKVALADLDGDGLKDVLFGAAAINFPPEMGVFAYGADGRERFVVRPQHRVVFGAKTYVGPWMPYHLFTTGAGDTLSLYLAFIGVDEFPSLLIEVDGRGRVRSEYWSNGYIEWVTRATWRGRDALFVGATHNDTRGASVAIFPDGRASGSAPAAQEKYRCTSCADGTPVEFIVFPRRALSEAYPGGTAGATVTDIRVLEDGRIRVNVGEGAVQSETGLFDSIVWYTLDPSLTRADAELTPGLFAEHARQFAAGLVRHPFGQADVDALFPVRKWDGRRFVDLSRGDVVR